MIIITTSQYNPKIDYLVCKNLAKGLEPNYDEERIRNVYLGFENAKTNFEIMMVKLNTIFKSYNLIENPNLLFQNLYSCIIGKEIIFKFTLNDVSYSNIKTILTKLVRKKLSIDNIFAYFQIYLFISLTLKYSIPIIPYHITSYRIFNGLISNSITEMIFDQEISLLVMRTMKLNQIHNVDYNKEVVKILASNKDSFLKNNSILNIGIYGSFSTNKANEYSDLDMLVVIKDSAEERTVRNYSYNFWSTIIKIPIDIKIIKSSELKNLNMHGLKRTLKYI